MDIDYVEGCVMCRRIDRLDERLMSEIVDLYAR